MISDNEKPLAALVAEVDAAVAQMTPGPWITDDSRPHTVLALDGSSIGGVLYNTNEVDVLGLVALRNAWPRVAAVLKLLHQICPSCEENAQLREQRNTAQDQRRKYEDARDAALAEIAQLRAALNGAHDAAVRYRAERVQLHATLANMTASRDRLLTVHAENDQLRATLARAQAALCGVLSDEALSTLTEVRRVLA